ncbi:MAG: histidinol-phosphatase HisJ [Intestinibacter sp.]
MKDGHVHTPYCPHGTDDTFDDYVRKGIEVGLDEISFTEHFPLPDGFKDPAPDDDSSIKLNQMNDYLKDVNEIKNKYKDKIKINVGAEVDYIEGYDEGIKALLDKYGEYLEDSVLSVHMIKIKDKYYCMDFSSEEFEKIINLLGSIEEVYNLYYDTLIKAVNSDLGIYKPKRIGHLNLVRKYNKKYPYDYSKNKKLKELVELISEKGYELDYNVAGLFKEDCGEAYINGYLAELVKKYNIKVVLGSDSHSAKYIDKYQINI